MGSYRISSILKVVLFSAFTVSCNGMTVLTPNEVYIPHKLGVESVYHDSEGFHVIKDDLIYDIQNCDCDKEVRGMTDENLCNFLGRNNPKVIHMTQEQFKEYCKTAEEIPYKIPQDQAERIFKTGYLVLDQVGDGIYTLKAKARLNGGGTITGLLFYYITKGVTVAVTVIVPAPIISAPTVHIVGEFAARGWQQIGNALPLP